MGDTYSTDSSEPTVRADVFALVATLGMVAKAASDDVLDTIDSDRQLSPAIAYTVYEQFYFLLIHVALRVAFTIAGPDGSASVHALLSPELLFRHIPHYLNARYKPRKISAFFLRELETQFVDRLNQSEFEYSQEQEFADMEFASVGVVGVNEGMKDQLARRLMDALVHSGVELDHTFLDRVKEIASRRIGDILPIATLVEDVTKDT